MAAPGLDVTVLATGFATGLSLILVIGAQNAFVLRQGLLRSHVFAVCLTCALSDAALILGGLLGFATATEALPWIPALLRYGGAAFLIVYGALRAKSAWDGSGGLGPAQEARSLAATLATCLALTWANPHVWLDTFGLIGGLAASHEGGARASFGAGAIAASFVFFFSLGYGARLLAPVMARPFTWRVLDAAIALLMWTIAAALLLE